MEGTETHRADRVPQCATSPPRKIILFYPSAALLSRKSRLRSFYSMLLSSNSEYVSIAATGWKITC